MNTTSNASSPMQAPVSSSPIRIVIHNFVPPSKNSLKGCHWSKLVRLKNQSYVALRNALKLHSESIPSDLATGTTTTQNIFKTHLSNLESYMVTHGMSFEEKSLPKRQARRIKKEWKLRLKK